MRRAETINTGNRNQRGRVMHTGNLTIYQPNIAGVSQTSAIFHISQEATIADTEDGNEQPPQKLLSS